MSAIVGEAEGPASVAQAQTAGGLLRAARQERGLHIAALAVMLKVPQAKLEAIESDRLADLPDATFARALAKAMCQALKIDAVPILALLPKTSEPGLDRVNLGLNQPFREHSMRSDGQFSLADLSRPIVWGPLLLLSLAALVYFMPADWLSRPQLSEPAAAASEPSVSTPVQMVPAPEPASENALAVVTPDPHASSSTVATVAAPAVAAVTAPAAALPQLPASTVAAPKPSLAPPAAAPASMPALAAPAKASAPASSVAAAVTATAQDGVPFRLHAVDDTWIEVLDARGRLRMSRLVKKGEKVEFDVPTPIKLRVGNVAGTEVWLRGAQVDLNSPSKDNVVRLDLN
jgi:cytoskeleton protein RodZ